MSAIRLEKFLHPVRPNAVARIVSPEEIEEIRKEAYENGVRDGADAASAAFSTTQSQTLARIHEVIGDAFLVREEAHRTALSSLRPLVLSLLQALAPALAKTGLSYEVADAVEYVVRTAPGDSLTIFVSAEDKPEIESLFTNSSTQLEILVDPDLAPQQARIGWNDGFDLIDLAANKQAVEDSINAYFAELDRQQKTEVNNGN